MLLIVLLILVNFKSAFSSWSRLDPSAVFEAEQLTGVKVDSEASRVRAAEILLDQGVGTVIITLGSQGAFVASPTLRQLVPGFKAKAIETTAAGDVFNGALAVALAEGKPLIDAVRFANAAGAIAVTRMGAQPSAPLRNEIEKLEKNSKRRRLDPPSQTPADGARAKSRARGTATTSR